MAVMNSAAVRPGESVVIYGLGGVGLAALLGAVASGANPIVAIDPSAEKRALALELGASIAADPGEADAALTVALPGGGLFTPVVRNAELKSLSEISNEMSDLATRARTKRLAPHEYQGGTTAVSNLGMYGIKDFTAVINPPHATILAVGTGEKRAIVRDGKIEAATVMSVTLSSDHRAVDGALGAELIGAFKVLIENPVMMVV